LNWLKIKLLNNLVRDIDEIVILLSLNLKIVDSNSIAKEKFIKVFDKKLVNGKYLADILPPSFNSNVNKYLKATISGQKQTFKFCLNKLNSTLEPSWFKIDFFPIYSNDVKIIGISLVVKCIDDVLLQTKQSILLKKRLRTILWKESHLFRSPLSNLLCISSLLIEDEQENKFSKNINSILIKHLKNEAINLDNIIRSNVKLFY